MQLRQELAVVGAENERLKEQVCSCTYKYTFVYTVEPLYKDAPEMRTSSLFRIPCMVPAALCRTMDKTTPEMGTTPLIMTF